MVNVLHTIYMKDLVFVYSLAEKAKQTNEIKQTHSQSTALIFKLQDPPYI